MKLQTKPWVRLVLAISIDGRLAMPFNNSKSLGGQGDRRVLEEALAWSDGALLGGGTLRIHRNTCLINSAELIQKRLSEKRTEQPISLVASRWEGTSLDLDFFKQPLERWLIRTVQITSSSPDKNIPPKGFHSMIPFAGCWSATLKKLFEFGLSRIVLLGGAHLVSSFLQEDLVDELQLTVVPRVIGGSYSWIPFDANPMPKTIAEPDSWILKSHSVLGENEFLLRYFRKRIASG